MFIVLLQNTKWNTIWFIQIALNNPVSKKSIAYFVILYLSSLLLKESFTLSFCVCLSVGDGEKKYRTYKEGPLKAHTQNILEKKKANDALA